jgi:hypothetical protein
MTADEAPEKLADCADDIESSLAASGKYWFAIEQIPKVVTESWYRDHSTINLRIKTPGMEDQKIAQSSMKSFTHHPMAHMAK